jgi:hypothetical protein
MWKMFKRQDGRSYFILGIGWTAQFVQIQEEHFN